MRSDRGNEDLLTLHGWMRGRGSSDRGIITTRMSFRAVHIFLIKSILAPSSLMGERFVQFSSEKSKKLSSRSLLYTPSAFYDFLINFFLSCFPFRAFYALRVFSEKFAWTESATFLFGSCLNVPVLLVHPGVLADPLIPLQDVLMIRTPMALLCLHL